MPPTIDRDKCIGCSKCVDACQCDVFFGSEVGEAPIITYPDECWHSNACVLACPHEGAIKLRIALPLMILFKEKTGVE